VHTAKYLGPKGSVAQITNGMNCDNCHINGGTTIFANNFSITDISYPKFRRRSNSIVNLATRINGCFKRSLNGIPPGDSSREMNAMIAYIKWVGEKANTKNVFGTATEKLSFLSRAADTLKGKDIFMAQCQVCHGQNGEGKFLEDGREYLYPPLWGRHSYTDGAGLYQLSNFAGFVKNNMPFGTSYKKPFLSNEQAWDVAAYINSRPRPVFKELLKDWPDISGKPADYPFGPYVDSFPESQHKYGPFDPIVLAQKSYKNQKEDLSKK
jgi:thiosulfate dehydrogenase